MKTLLISTYELGHQPLHIALPAASLQGAGHAVRCRDLSVQPWSTTDIAWADAVAFSIPMYTAMRLAHHAIRRIRQSRPHMPICLYGLYAHIGGASSDTSPVKTISGEYLAELLNWVESIGTLHNPPVSSTPVVDLQRQDPQVPSRSNLPQLNNYAQLELNGEHRLAGYVEASHGCTHLCKHCPVPALYKGKIRVVDEDVVLNDIANLVTMGAQHISFGDPDFLNAPRHSIRIIRRMHETFSDITFDCTTKVEHILRNAAIWEEMSAAGCIFVVSAFECLNDDILVRLDKGHTAKDSSRSVKVLRQHGIEPRPSFLPFTPWSTVQDVFDILDFVATNTLVSNVDPIQYSIRLLIPPGSLILDDPDCPTYLKEFDQETLSYVWKPTNPLLDVLQKQLVAVAENAAQTEEAPLVTFLKIREAVLGSAESIHPRSKTLVTADQSDHNSPRLTEPWFC